MTDVIAPPIVTSVDARRPTGGPAANEDSASAATFALVLATMQPTPPVPVVSVATAATSPTAATTATTTTTATTATGTGTTAAATNPDAAAPSLVCQCGAAIAPVDPRIAAATASTAPPPVPPSAGTPVPGTAPADAPTVLTEAGGGVAPERPVRPHSTEPASLPASERTAPADPASTPALPVHDGALPQDPAGAADVAGLRAMAPHPGRHEPSCGDPAHRGLVVAPVAVGDHHDGHASAGDAPPDDEPGALDGVPEPATAPSTPALDVPRLEASDHRLSTVHVGRRGDTVDPPNEPSGLGTRMPTDDVARPSLLLPLNAHHHRRLEVAMHHDQLGAIRIGAAEDRGAIHISLLADNAASSAVLQEHAAQLSDHLMHHGVSVGQVDVRHGGGTAHGHARPMPSFPDITGSGSTTDDDRASASLPHSIHRLPDADRRVDLLL